MSDKSELQLSALIDLAIENQLQDHYDINSAVLHGDNIASSDDDKLEAYLDIFESVGLYYKQGVLDKSHLHNSHNAILWAMKNHKHVQAKLEQFKSTTQYENVRWLLGAYCND